MTADNDFTYRHCADLDPVEDAERRYHEDPTIENRLAWEMAAEDWAANLVREIREEQAR